MAFQLVATFLDFPLPFGTAFDDELWSKLFVFCLFVCSHTEVMDRHAMTHWYLWFAIIESGMIVHDTCFKKEAQWTLFIIFRPRCLRPLTHDGCQNCTTSLGDNIPTNLDFTAMQVMFLAFVHCWDTVSVWRYPTHLEIVVMALKSHLWNFVIRCVSENGRPGPCKVRRFFLFSSSVQAS